MGDYPGVKFERLTFYFTSIRNPVYVGCIHGIDQNGVDLNIAGQHVGIVPSTVFEKVQQFTRRKRMDCKLKGKFRESFMLKGYLICPKCSKNLTASSSLGRFQKYDYYHCVSSCGFRVRADIYNIKFLDFLNQLHPIKSFSSRCMQIVSEAFEKNKIKVIAKVKQTINSIKRIDERLNRLKELFLESFIDLGLYSQEKIGLDKRRKMQIDIVTTSDSLIEAIPTQVKRVMKLIDHPLIMYKSLSSELKPEFLQLLLIPAWVIKNEITAGILKESANIFFGIKEPKKAVQNELTQLLTNLSNLAINKV